MVKKYIAIDLKSFYASVECVERGLDPLTTNLVVADESRTEKTICLAVSPCLKKYGIPGRARLFEVIQRCKEIKATTGKDVSYIIAQPRMQLYIDYSSKIYNIYMKYISPEDIHVYSIDEVFMDVSKYLKLYHDDKGQPLSVHDLVSKIIKDVYAETGITATAGIGTNMYLAKIAMDIVAKYSEADADGVRIAELNEMSYRQLLWEHRPLTDFWRVGRGISKKLEANGMYTMGDIARMSVSNLGYGTGEDLLFELFGIDAELLIDHAWGVEPCTMEDIKNYKPTTNSISSGQVLSCSYDFEKCRIVVKEMVELQVLELVAKKLVTDHVTLDIGYDKNIKKCKYSGPMAMDHYGRTVPKPAHGSCKLKEPTSSTEKIMAAVLEIYDRIVEKNLYIKRLTQGKYGKNAILRGINLQEGATTIERNQQIGGHKA